MTDTSGDLPVAVDTLGGDRGLDVQVEGAVLAHKEFGSKCILVGPEEILRSRLDLLGAREYPISVHPASETIGMDEVPTKAVRRKPNSSLCIAYGLVQAGKASSVLSAGNSGAMMAAGRLMCGLLPGIERPAIATLIPVAGEGRPTVILDSGANVDCHAHNLVQFAIMGSIYCSSLVGTERPKVALLSNGTEPSKGTDVLRAAAVMLRNVPSMDYIGYVEGREIATHTADVIVCDGFTGNLVLKSMEGCVRLFFDQLMIERSKRLMWRVGMFLAQGALRRVFLERFDYTAYGGAPLLGLRKLALVLHGSSDRRAVKNAIRVAETFARRGMTEKISAELTQLEERLPEVEGNLFNSMIERRSMLRNGQGPLLGRRSPVVEDEGDEGE